MRWRDDFFRVYCSSACISCPTSERTDALNDPEHRDSPDGVRRYQTENGERLRILDTPTAAAL